MPIPSRVDAARILDTLDPPVWFLRHVSGVAEVAASLARSASRRGVRVDRRLVESAALLHDVDKLLPDDDPRKALGHGWAGARWLEDRGYRELAPAVEGHPVSRLGDDRFHERWVREASLEERIVAYADKRVGQRLGSLDARFAAWERRSSAPPERMRRARERAERLEDEVCRAAGVGPPDVRRLRWVASARRMAGSGSSRANGDTKDRA